MKVGVEVVVIMKLCLCQFAFISAGAFSIVRVGHVGQTDAETSFSSDLQVCFYCM